MLWFIISVLIITTGVSITLLVLTKKEIANITSNLFEINSIDTNKQLMLSSPNRQLENLAAEINKAIDQKQKTQAKYREIDHELRQAIANISHDLRTPLTSIIGYIQLMKDETILQSERSYYADIVLKRAKSLNVLLSGFFDLSRLEADEYSFELKPVYVSNILCELIASFYNDFINKNIDPQIDIEEGVPQITADEIAVRRVFTNLVQNALKYGRSFIAVSLKQQKNTIEAVFTNDAPNLTEDDTKHLFERFFTADRTRNGQSTGLGLAITKELVEKMGGNITACLNDGSLRIKINWPTPANNIDPFL